VADRAGDHLGFQRDVAVVGIALDEVTTRCVRAL
jgi:hypothetical protein